GGLWALPWHKVAGRRAIHARGSVPRALVDRRPRTAAYGLGDAARPHASAALSGSGRRLQLVHRGRRRGQCAGTGVPRRRPDPSPTRPGRMATYPADSLRDYPTSDAPSRFPGQSVHMASRTFTLERTPEESHVVAPRGQDLAQRLKNRQLAMMTCTFSRT